MPSMASMWPGTTESEWVATKSRGRHALQRGIDGGEQHRRPVVALEPRKPRQRRHALRDHTGVRRHPVVGQAVPGRKFHHRDVGREERERTRERRHARTVAADRPAGSSPAHGARRHRARQIGDDEPLGAIGDAGERQRPARLKQIGGRRAARLQRAMHQRRRQVEIAHPPEHAVSTSPGTSASPVTQASRSRSGKLDQALELGKFRIAERPIARRRIGP